MWQSVIKWDLEWHSGVMNIAYRATCGALKQGEPILLISLQRLRSCDNCYYVHLLSRKDLC